MVVVGLLLLLQLVQRVRVVAARDPAHAGREVEAGRETGREAETEARGETGRAAGRRRRHRCRGRRRGRRRCGEAARNPLREGERVWVFELQPLVRARVAAWVRNRKRVQVHWLCAACSCSSQHARCCGGLGARCQRAAQARRRGGKAHMIRGACARGGVRGRTLRCRGGGSDGRLGGGARLRRVVVHRSAELGSAEHDNRAHLQHVVERKLSVERRLERLHRGPPVAGAWGAHRVVSHGGDDGWRYPNSRTGGYIDRAGQRWADVTALGVRTPQITAPDGITVAAESCVSPLRAMVGSVYSPGLNPEPVPACDIRRARCPTCAAATPSHNGSRRTGSPTRRTPARRSLNHLRGAAVWEERV